MTGANEESSLESFGRAMPDCRCDDNVASDAEVNGILDRLARGSAEGGTGILNANALDAGVQELTAVCELAFQHSAGRPHVPRRPRGFG